MGRKLKVRNVPQPTVAEVGSYQCQWQTLEKYKLQEHSLGLLFQNLCPHNTDILHVLLKASALNDFYSTNIYDIHGVAKHIVAKDVDDRLSAGDCSLVNDIASVVLGGKKRNLFSFASKYCNHHNPEAFPIYDYYVEKMLLHFKTESRFVDFDKEQLKIYSDFVEIIRLFRAHYSLEQFSLRQIDIYLWLAGKKAFPKKYAQNKSPQ